MGLVVGITGGSAAGKTTVAGLLAAALRDADPLVLSVDRYFRDRTDCTPAQWAELNYDEPAALDLDRLADDVAQLRAGRPVRVPVYDFVSRAATLEAVPTRPAPVLVVEGILLFVTPALRATIDCKVFVDADPAVRLRRRIARDVRERGWTEDQVVRQFFGTVEDGFRRHIEPTRRDADFVLDWNETNTAGLAALVAMIRARVAA